MPACASRSVNRIEVYWAEPKVRARPRPQRDGRLHGPCRCRRGQRGHGELLQPAAEERPRPPPMGHPRTTADRDRHLDRTHLPPSPAPSSTRPIDPHRIRDHHDHTGQSGRVTRSVTKSCSRPLHGHVVGAAIMAITSSMIVISNSCSQHRRRPSHDLPMARAKSARLLGRQPDSGRSLPAGSADGAARHIKSRIMRRPGPRSAHFRARSVSPSLPAPRFWSRATSGRKWLHGQSRDALWRSDSKIGR